MYDDNIFAGDLLYDYLANEANAASAQITPDWFGYSLLPEYTYDTNHLFPASPSSSVTSPSATYVITLMLLYFPGTRLTSHL